MIWQRALAGLAAFALLLGPAVAVARPSSLPEGTNRTYHGYLRQGGRFGIRIGGSASEARRILEAQGFRYAATKDCYYELKGLVPCREGEPQDVYWLEKPFKQGGLFVFHDRDRIVAIVWLFDLLPYLDS